MKLGLSANIFLFMICGASLLLALPTINRNIDDPNAIVYINNDEGYQMDLIWSYYSGQRRGSYQMSLDYGLEMVYLSDTARLIFSKFINFTPGTFVLILRWVHLLGWIGAMIAIWFLVGYNFGKGWKQILAVSLLWSRPAFNYFQIGLKPDPVALLFVIIGLYAALRMTEKPSLKYIVIATACAAIGVVIKFYGIFLIPAIVAALYLSVSHKDSPNSFLSPTGPLVKRAWVFPMCVSIPFIISPFLAIFYYVRKATGLTYYEEFGILQSISKHRVIYMVWLAAIMLIALSIALFYLNKSKKQPVIKAMSVINRINACSIVVVSLFLVFIAIFGFRWFSISEKFLETYALHFMDVSGVDASAHVVKLSEFFSLLVRTIISKINTFSVPLLFLLSAYLWVEAYSYKMGINAGKALFHKRLILLVYIFPILPLLLCAGRFEQLHMLPPLIGVFLLTIEGAFMFGVIAKKDKILGRMALAVVTILFVADIALNSTTMLKMRFDAFRRSEDAAFDAGKYLKENIPYGKYILADHYTRVYIPPLYDNLMMIPWNESDKAGKLRELAGKRTPEIIYYNDRLNDKERMPPIEKLLPDKRLKLLGVFEQKGGSFHRYPGSRFFIYEVLK